MRVALKPASNNAETSQTTGTKSSGESFLDILSQGTQGVQAPKAASSQAQQGDAEAQQESSEQDQKSTAQTSASATAVPPPAKNPNPPPAIAPQGAAAASTQASSNIQSNTIAQKIAALAGMIDPLSAQATVDAETLQATQSSGKSTPPAPAKNAKSDAASSKSDSAAASAAAALQLLVPVQAQPLPDQSLGLKNATSGSPFVDPVPTGAADGQSALGASAAAKAQPNANPQAASAAEAFAKSIADGAAGATQAGTPDASATGSDAANAASNANAAQTGNPLQAGAQAQAVAGEFLAATLGQNALSAQATLDKAGSSNAKTANASFNANGAASTPASASGVASNAAKKIVPDADSSTQTSSDGSQASAPVVARPAAADASQAIAFGTVTSHPTTPQAPATAPTAGTGGTTAGADGTTKHAGDAAGLPGDSAQNAVGSSAINSARLIQTMSESEMRVGLRSSEFGDISIRTMVSQQQVQAQISVDHSELANALTGHIATTQAKIGNEFGLHASIEVSQGGASFSGDRGQSPSQQDYKPFAASLQIDGGTPGTDTTEKLPLRPLTSAVEGARLDIRA